MIEVFDKPIEPPTWQDLADSVGRTIDRRLSELWINTWMGESSNGNPALFVAKLLCRVARNILRLAYNVVKCVLYTLVHPVKAIKELGQNLKLLAEELRKPETRIKIGSGVMGASLGNFLITGNPLCFIGVGIGCLTLLWGLYTVDKIERKHLKMMLDSFCTGLVIGLAFGGIWESQLDRAELTDPTAIATATTTETLNQVNAQVVTMPSVKN